MNCLITGEPWAGPGPYSPAGLQRLDRRLTSLEILPYTRAELLTQAATRALKMSVQGAQPKVSAVLRVTAGRMELVDTAGRFILKPPHLAFAEVPENEALTMSLAATLGIEVPLHGLLLNRDNTHTYFVRRFDRLGWRKLPLEDFAQLSGATRDTKYSSTTEDLIALLNTHCTFPALERPKFLDRLLCAFLTGNEDMHLKNWSLITRANKVELAPAYDLLATFLAVPGATEELALPLNQKKSNLRSHDFWDYLARDQLGLSAGHIAATKARFANATAAWPDRIARSFLSAEMKTRYLALLRSRRLRLEFD